ncbi:SDR family NAD(P)-dependent oxidoreductase [Aestuariirhabdus sp. Z084]|uniref:SDR family NAD(P)-dependent oxidoreductase n=1 Tax=Aestuariirhabdus haliotis TaxID=2918751 RepID=UPI00201B3D95|nr:SDR family NAD(P)-dependent oxidoreductase [Aestuariirhabdus haliotis]MCL6417129.1 SDR family NAD(P)-dependent oxidoreductase [Aestuariirhabdus haliotis]MCL6421079.1 SDR family NAD(P)-dependent oxidoreductase [Aestuariirhabdus haliotis]
MHRIILLTGATDGIGLVTAEKLVAEGHHLLLHGRNPAKLQTVENKLKALSAGVVESYQADMSDLSEVEKLARQVSERHTRLDVIINNAGVYKTDQPITKDHLDVRFVVNTLAPYLLTKRLMPLMDRTGRVVNLASAAQEAVDLDAMAGNQAVKEDFSAYGQSKLALTMWSRQMAHGLGDTGPAIIAVNPGSLLASKMVKEGFGVAGKDLAIGADVLMRAALSEEFAKASGLYFDNDIGQFGQPHSDALNDTKCEQLVLAIEQQLTALGLPV